ncbi:MAG TPA: EAL domain-containing protein [Acidimicrobiales bacterium]|nr:EAL domain-containing protein [Acidimicrobiales bacterium]
MAKNAAPRETGQRAGPLGAQFANALAGREFFLVYQPAIDLQTGAFAGVEALIRWRHPTRGVLSPEDFLDDLSASDQVGAVGRWTLEKACRQGALWHRKGYRFSVSVNVAPRQFADAGFVDDVVAALNASRFNPTLLVLEFAQRTLTSKDPDTAARLARLVGLGVRLAVDDFELGRSSLDDLADLFVTTVKVSRESVASVVGAAKGTANLHKLVALARARGVQVIASGVEDSAQRELLAAERVDQGQGYLFSRPYEVDEIDRSLEDFSLFSGKPL